MPCGLDEAGASCLGQSLAPLVDEGGVHRRLGQPHPQSLRVPPGRDRGRVLRDRPRPLGPGRPVLAGDTDRLLRAVQDAPDGSRAHPTTEHYLPLLLAVGAGAGVSATLLDGGIRHGVLAMASYAFERSSTVT